MSSKTNSRPAEVLAQLLDKVLPNDPVSLYNLRINFSIYITAFALAIMGMSTQAQTVNTTPLGLVSFPINHGTTTYLSLPLEGNPIYTGVISATTANSITVADSPAPWTAGALATAAQPYFVKFLAGPQAGRTLLITANTTNTLTLDTTDHTSQTTPILSSPSSSFDVQVGNSFKIFPGQTLATLFGAGTTQNPLSYLVGSTNVAQADTVSLFTTSTAPASTYYFDTAAGAGFWTLYPTTVNANNTILYPYSSLAITRRSANGDTTLPLTGCATNVPLLIKAPGKTTSYTSAQYPANLALSQLQFGANWTQGTSIANADTLSVWNPSPLPGHFDTYYQLSADSTWRKYPNSATDVSSFVIPAGSAICITKRSNATGAASYLQPPLPYTLQNTSP